MNSTHFEENKKEPFNKAISILLKAQIICKIPKIVYEFECPVCHHIAKAINPESNDHIHGGCDHCNVKFFQ